MARRIFSLLISFSLLFQQIGFASIATELNIAGHLSKMSSAFTPDRFRPEHIRFFSYDALNDNIKVMLDKGDAKNLKVGQINESTRELLNYFLVGLNLPNDKFWVNLRPDSEDQIIDQYLEKTDVGRIMLEADLQLKKDTAQMTSPATPEGREYWNKLYKKAEELYGYENVTIPTLTRPWIVPGEIIIRETTDDGSWIMDGGKKVKNMPSAYIYKATLKVMLEQDYLKDSTLALTSAYSFKDERSRVLNEYSTQLIRELIIPKLTKEVNLSKRYAPLRQVYYSIILSRWFKSRFNGQAGKYASRIDRKDLSGLTSVAAWSKATYFEAYKNSFAKGEYNVKETVRTPTGQVIRSYFSGGMDLKLMPINGGTAASPIAAALTKAGLVAPGGSSPITVSKDFIPEADSAQVKAKAREIAKLMLLKINGRALNATQQKHIADAYLTLLLPLFREAKGKYPSAYEADNLLTRVFSKYPLLSPKFTGRDFEAQYQDQLTVVMADILRENSLAIRNASPKQAGPSTSLSTSGEQAQARQTTTAAPKTSSPLSDEAINKAMDLFGELFGRLSRWRQEAARSYLEGKFSLSQAAQVFVFVSDGLMSFEDAKIPTIITFLAAKNNFLERESFGSLRKAIEFAYKNPSENGYAQAERMIGENIGGDTVKAAAILDDAFDLFNSAVPLSKEEDQSLQLFLLRVRDSNFSASSAVTNHEAFQDHQQRVNQINSLLSSINAEEEQFGSGNLPTIVHISDYHGEIRLFLDYIADAISQEIGRKIVLDHKKFPTTSILEQLRAQGVDISTVNISFYLLGDLLDRGQYGIKCFFAAKELIESGMAKYVTGNHDLWAFLNLMGYHLPVYKGYNFYGHQESERLVKQHWDDADIAADRIGWWTAKLAQYNASQKEFQKGELNINGEDVLVADIRKELKAIYLEIKSQLGKDENVLWEDLVGFYFGNTDVYTGFNGIGMMSAEWWNDKLERVNHALQSAKKGEPSHAIEIWEKLQAYTEVASKMVNERLKRAHDEGKWWWQVFNDINHQNYDSVEWWGKDWSSHSGWGTSVIDELNEFEGAKKWNQENYIHNPLLQELALFYRKQFNLLLKDPYGNIATHGWLPVDSQGQVKFTYKGKKYEGKQVWDGLSTITNDISDMNKSLPEIHEALSLVNSWYADKTTAIKPKNIDSYINEIGLETIYQNLGIWTWITCHNPLNKLAPFGVGFITDQSGRLHFSVDNGMSWQKFLGLGGYSVIDHTGIRLRGYSDTGFSEIIDNPNIVLLKDEKEKGFNVKNTWPNESLSRKEFLRLMKLQLEQEKIGLLLQNPSLVGGSLAAQLRPTPQRPVHDIEVYARQLAAMVVRNFEKYQTRSFLSFAKEPELRILPAFECDRGAINEKALGMLSDLKEGIIPLNEDTQASLTAEFVAALRAQGIRTKASSAVNDSINQLSLLLEILAEAGKATFDSRGGVSMSYGNVVDVGDKSVAHMVLNQPAVLFNLAKQISSQAKQPGEWSMEIAQGTPAETIRKELMQRYGITEAGSTIELQVKVFELFQYLTYVYKFRKVDNYYKINEYLDKAFELPRQLSWAAEFYKYYEIKGDERSFKNALAVLLLSNDPTYQKGAWWILQEKFNYKPDDMERFFKEFIKRDRGFDSNVDIGIMVRFFRQEVAGLPQAASSAVEKENSLEFAEYLRELLNSHGVSKMTVDIDGLILDFVMQGKKLKLDSSLDKAINSNPNSKVTVTQITGTRQYVVELKSTLASSAVDAKVDSAVAPGGIDFRPDALMINYQPMGNFVGLNPKLPVLSKAELAGFDIDKELSAMEKMVEQGQIVPSGRRIKEALAALSAKGKLETNRERVMVLLVKVGMLEETQCCLQEASNEYKEALVLTDSLA